MLDAVQTMGEERASDHDDHESPTTFQALLASAAVSEDRARLLADAHACLSGKSETFECEYRVLDDDGGVQWKLARGVAIRDVDGRPVRFTGTSVYVTRLKHVEEDARLANERLALAAQLSGFAVT
jgi:PAS domain-containing protein